MSFSVLLLIVIVIRHFLPATGSYIHEAVCHFPSFYY